MRRRAARGLASESRPIRLSANTMPRECSSWAALYEDLSSRVVQVLVVLAEEADGVEGLAVAKSYAALLCVNRHWRAVALQVRVAFCSMAACTAQPLAHQEEPSCWAGRPARRSQGE